jgi:predicted  nucleic acid-binding Zn-ribbon protein
MKEKTLNEQIQATANLLAQLETEQADLPKRMAIAADDADSASLISLKHRVNNLPIELTATQIILERLYLQRDELRLPELQNVVSELAKPIEGMLKRIADLQQEFNVASGNVSSATEDVRETRNAISERRRSIESLLAQARNVKIAPTSLQMHGGG